MSFVRAYGEIVAHIDTIEAVEYARTRNHLSGAVTKLSPYLSRGVITLPQVRERLLERCTPAECQKLVQELAWREYFQNVWWEKGDAIFSDLRFSRDDWRHTELVTAIVSADTGITVLDESIKQLYATGYLHNHARMWVASVASNLARAHWYPMGQWMYYHLMDGDPASNFCSWQWVAGMSVNKRYTVNQALIDACSDSVQPDSYLAIARDDMLTMDTPACLQASEPVALALEYPASSVSAVAADTVHLYTPWTLNPTWRSDETAQRILIIDPNFFERLPVSAEVFDFIVRQGQTVMPDLEVFVGQPYELGGIDSASTVRAIAHQTNQDWLVQFDEPERLFPAVQGYYPSFFKYWQAVTKLYPVWR